MSEDFFVHIEDPVAIRKSILETSKDVIKGLQNFEMFKETRVQKVEAMAEFKKIMGELDQLNGQLNSLLPKSSFRKIPESEDVGRPAVKRVIKTKKESDMEKLERELENIEGKLSNLS